MIIKKNRRFIILYILCRSSKSVRAVQLISDCCGALNFDRYATGMHAGPAGCIVASRSVQLCVARALSLPSRLQWEEGQDKKQANSSSKLLSGFGSGRMGNPSTPGLPRAARGEAHQLNTLFPKSLNVPSAIRDTFRSVLSSAAFYLFRPTERKREINRESGVWEKCKWVRERVFSGGDFSLTCVVVTPDAKSCAPAPPHRCPALAQTSAKISVEPAPSLCRLFIIFKFHTISYLIRETFATTSFNIKLWKSNPSSITVKLAIFRLIYLIFDRLLIVYIWFLFEWNLCTILYCANFKTNIYK